MKENILQATVLVFYYCYNKLLQTWQLKLIHIYYLSSVSQKSGLAQLVSLLWVSQGPNQVAGCLVSYKEALGRTTCRLMSGYWYNSVLGAIRQIDARLSLLALSWGSLQLLEILFHSLHMGPYNSGSNLMIGIPLTSLPVESLFRFQPEKVFGW